MFRSASVALVLGVLASTAAAQSRPPAPAPAPAVGAPVRGAGGEMLGRIESVTRDSAGRPVQVVIRSRGLAGARAQSRAIPVAGLRPEGSGWVTPLRRTEFDLLPPVQR